MLRLKMSPSKINKEKGTMSIKMHRSELTTNESLHGTNQLPKLKTNKQTTKNS